MRKLNAALDHLANRRRAREVLVTEAARGFIRNVVAITPPASQGVKGLAAKQQGERAVIRDLLKLAHPATTTGRRGAGLATAAQLLAAHEAAHRGVAGVNARNRTLLLVAPADMNKVIVLLQKRVGWLAAGWNAAAALLGVTMPLWIRRHGSSRGNALLLRGALGIRLSVTNAVGFVGDVKHYFRIVQFALDWQASKMSRNAAHALSQDVKKAGF